MGLYLCVFDGEEDVDGIDVGAYCLFDVDGENLFERLRGLAQLARRIDGPILFQ